MAFEQYYQQWVNLTREEEDLALELQAVKTDKKALEDRFYQDLAFGTGGMRGIIGAGRNRINIFTIRRAAAGLADLLNSDPTKPRKSVAIGFDSRKFSGRFARETALVLAARGIKAYLFDSLRPVPLLSFAVRHLQADAGVVITASHNPPEYNGFKVYDWDGGQLPPDKAEQVTAFIRKLTFEEALPMPEKEALEQGLLEIIGPEVDDAYTAMVLKLMVRPELVRQVGADLKIVYTPLHGSGNLPVRRTLKEAGISNVTVVKEQELPDPNFSTVKSPNPEDPAAFTLAIPLAEAVGATVIMGTDPDCDRLGVCVKNPEGHFITLNGNQIASILLHHILSARKQDGSLPANGAVIMSIVSTNLARAICEDYGVTLFEVLTGFKFVGEKILEFEKTGSHSFLFGFEESYGYLSGTDVRDKDAVNAALLVAEAACVCMHEGITLYERLQQIYQKYGYYIETTWSGTYPGKEGADKILSIMGTLRGSAPDSIGGLKVLAVRDYLARTVTKDGQTTALTFPSSDVVYFDLEGGAWACARPSGTEPKIKFYVGISHPDSMEAAEDAAKNLLEAFKGMAE
ncbi:MAG: phospho-sugar mutase [Clostridiales bacterium]|nr:phospho-sugar mutase [Clostridiales bacterium]